MAHAQKPDLVLQRNVRDDTCAETRFGLSAKRTSPFKSAGWRQFSRLLRSRGVRMRGSNAGYTVFRGRVQDYWLPTAFSGSNAYTPCSEVV